MTTIEASESSSATIQHLPGDGEPPLSVSQEGWLLLEAARRSRSPAVESFHVARGFRVRGRLDVAALERALNATIARHEALRTGFLVRRGEAHERTRDASRRPPGHLPFKAFVCRNALVRIGVVGLERLGARERDEAAWRIGADLVNRPFDYGAPPLLRLALLRSAGDNHVLVVVVHHLVCDGWSLLILLQELSAFYGRFTRGQGSIPEQSPIQYVDFARWQRQWLSSGGHRAAASYWRRHLSEFGPTMIQTRDIPFGHVKPSLRNPIKREDRAVIDAACADRLRQFARERGVTRFTLFMTAFYLVLHACTGKPRIAIRAHFANRSMLEVERVIGWFAESHIVGVVCTPDLPVSRLLERTRETMRGALRHQNVPHAWLWRTSPPSVLPMSDLYVSLDFAADDPVTLDGLSVQPFVLPQAMPHRALELLVTESRTDITIACRYSAYAFSSSGVLTMLASVRQALERMASDPESLVSDVVAALPCARDVAQTGTDGHASEQGVRHG